MALSLLELFAKISLDSSEYEKGLSAASGLTKTFGDGAKAALGAVAKVAAVGLTAASGAVVAFGASAVNVGSQFDSSMAQVAATMGKTVGEISNLRDFAMEMGAKTAFSATQAAEALNYMALAGYSAETSMKVLPTVLNLAAAGGMELGSASDMITDSLSALGLESEYAATLVDQMASASSHANASVSQMGSAILTVGGTAKVLSGGMMTLSDGTKQAYSATTELNQVLGLLADNGVKGAEGGTALRNIILSLTAPTDKAAKTLKNLGVKALDSSGNMRSMKDIFADLNKAMSNMSEGKKTEVLNEIFNKVDLKSVNALMGTNVKRWDELASSIENSKYAAEKMADVQLDNLAGDVTLLKSAFEGAQIMVSDMLTPSLREFVQLGTSGLTAVTDAFKNAEVAKSLAAGFKDAEGVMKPIEENADAIRDKLSAFRTLAPYFSFRDEAGELGEVSDLADGLYQTLSQLTAEQQQSLAEAWGLDNADALYEIIDPANELQWKLEKMIATADSAMQSDANILQSIFPGHEMEEILSWLDGSEEGLANLQSALDTVDASNVTDGFSAAMEALPGVINDGISILMSGIPKVLEVGGQVLGAVVSGIVTNLPMLADGAMQIVTSFGDYLLDAGPAMLDKGAELLTFIGNGLSEGIPALTEKASEFAPAIAQGLAEGIPAAAGSIADAVMSLGALIGENAPSLIESGVTLLEGLVTGIMDGLPKLTEAAGNLMESFGAYLRDNLPTLAENGLAMLESLSGSIRENAGKLVDSGLEMLLNLAQGFADSIPAIIEHVPTIISNIAGVINDNAPKIIATGVKIIVTLAKGLIQAIPTLIANIPKIIKMIVDVWTAFNWLNLGKNAIELIQNGINALKTKIPEALKKIGETAKNFFKNIDWKGLGTSAINLLKNGVTALKDAIPNALRSIATAAKEKFTSIDWISVGKNLVTGLWNGILSLKDWILGKVGGFVSSVMGAFTGPKGFDEHSPSKWAKRVGEYVTIGLANGIEEKASEAEQAAEKMASNVYNGLSKWAEKTIKYERLSLQEQLELWQEIQGQFKRDSEQWLAAYDKIWDIQEKIADERKKELEEQAKAEEQSVKDSYSALTKWLDKAVKYTDASYTTQMRMWRQALGAFASDSEQYADIEEKIFGLRLSAYQEYADSVEKISDNINAIQADYDKAVSDRTGEIVKSYKLFEAVPEKQEASGKQLFANLQGQIQRIRSFYSNLTKLQERGMSAAVVDEIRSMGVSASDELEALLQLSDKKLAQYAGLYEEKQSLANSIALDELDGLKAETESKIAEQMEGLRTLYEENAPAIGESFAEGLAQGIREGLAGVTEAAVEVAQSAMERTREILGLGPSADAAPTRYSVASPAYSNAVTASGGGGAGDELRYSPITFTVNNNVGGTTYAQLQYPFDSAEAIRRGPSILNAS